MIAEEKKEAEWILMRPVNPALQQLGRVMVQCPTCEHLPNECYRSRWFKQVISIPLLRIRWRCTRCGTGFSDWLWSEPPRNNPYQQQETSDQGTSDGGSVSDCNAISHVPRARKREAIGRELDHAI